nr:MAG TPA: hypothetical protein [Caudoviricetes sp.]
MYMLKYLEAVGTLIPICLAATESVIRPLQNASNASKNFFLLMVFTPFAITRTAFRFYSKNSMAGLEPASQQCDSHLHHMLNPFSSIEEQFNVFMFLVHRSLHVYSQANNPGQVRFIADLKDCFRPRIFTTI